MGRTAIQLASTLAQTSSAYLFQHKFPIYPYRSFPVFFAVLSEPATHLTHPLKTVTAIEKILDILCHDLGDIFQLIIQLVQVCACSAVLICFLGPLDECVEFDERIWT
jgi:hypothetical protein